MTRVIAMLAAVLLLLVAAAHLGGCPQDLGTACPTDNKCPVGGQMILAKHASGTCGADLKFYPTGVTTASGTCSAEGDCQYACIYPTCPAGTQLEITATAFRCTVSKCAGVTCDERGVCRIDQDQPVCVCTAGFKANGLHCDEVTTCKINGHTYKKYARNPADGSNTAPCEICDPVFAQTDWTDCDDGTPCLLGGGPGMCQGGVCKPDMLVTEPDGGL